MIEKRNVATSVRVKCDDSDDDMFRRAAAAMNGGLSKAASSRDAEAEKADEEAESN